MAIRDTVNNAHPSYTAAAPPNPSTAFTFAAWVKVATDTNTFATICRLHSSGGGATCCVVGMQSDGTTPSAFSAGGTITGSSVTPGDWHYVAGAWAGSAAALYQCQSGGSSSYTTGTVAPGTTPDGFTLLGRSAGDTSETFNGDMAYARMWSAKLTQAELDAERYSATPVRTANLFDFWRLAAHTDLTGTQGHNLVANTGSLSTVSDPPNIGGNPSMATFFHA